MVKRLVFIFIATALAISLLGCSGKNLNGGKEVKPSISPGSQEEQENQQNPGDTGQNNGKLTLDDVKANYNGRENGQLINATTYKDSFVLVEYKNDANIQSFDWYNLETGDRDTLPLGPYHAKLRKIENENLILFETNGVLEYDGITYFPEIYRCCRQEEVTGLNGEFDMRSEPLYLPVKEGFEFGGKTNIIIADIKVSLRGVEVLFKPEKGYESDFYTPYSYYPLTKTSFDKAGNKFIIEFENTGMENRFEPENKRAKHLY
jgi:hypothetical protein